MSATLCAAMASAFAEIEGAAKDKANPAFRSRYADLPAVIDAIKPALVKHRLFFTQITHDQEGGVCVETVVHHESGESMSLGRLFVPASKRDAHGYGSALTYARRYSLMTAFGVPAEDDDGNAAARSVSAAPAAPPALIDDTQGDLIAMLADEAGRALPDICRAYKIASIRDLTREQGEKLIARLRREVAARESQQDAAA